MMGFVSWLIIGLVAGSLARLLVPGRQSMSLLWTTGLGLLGSIVGGVVALAVYGYDRTAPGLPTAGLVASTIGAIVVLGAFVAYSRRRPIIKAPSLFK